MIEAMRSNGSGTIPQIMHLFAYKPEVTRGLEEFTQAVMRGPSPLSPGLRELIAAFTSRRATAAASVAGRFSSRQLLPEFKGANPFQSPARS